MGLDKDNDLRCRVNKRANLMFGMNPSPQKTAFMENEFKRRQAKRRGRAPSPSSADGTDSSDNMYAAILNNPEFANILMSLLAQKGLDSGDSETSAQLVELLKSNPDFLRGYLANAPEPMDTQEQPNTTEIQEYSNSTSTFQNPTELNISSQSLHLENLSMESQGYNDSSGDVNSNIPEASRPAPIPRLGVTSEIGTIPIPTQSSVSVPSYPSIPATSVYIPAPIPSTRVHTPPSQERVRALGFPPMMGQPQR